MITGAPIPLLFIAGAPEPFIIPMGAPVTLDQAIGKVSTVKRSSL